MTSNDNQCANDGIPSRDVRIVAVIMNMSERGERETRLKLIRELVESELLPLNAVQSVADITDNKCLRTVVAHGQENLEALLELASDPNWVVSVIEEIEERFDASDDVWKLGLGRQVVSLLERISEQQWDRNLIDFGIPFEKIAFEEMFDIASLCPENRKDVISQRIAKVAVARDALEDSIVLRIGNLANDKHVWTYLNQLLDERPQKNIALTAAIQSRIELLNKVKELNHTVETCRCSLRNQTEELENRICKLQQELVPLVSAVQEPVCI